MLPVKRIWRRSGATQVLVVGAHRLEWGVADGPGKWRAGSIGRIDFDSLNDRTAQLDALDDALGHVPGAAGLGALRVLVADSWLAACTVPWSTSFAGAAAQPLAAARARLVQAGFSIDVRDTVRLDDAPFGMPRLAVAYPAPLLDALAHLGTRLQAPLASVLPMSAAAWSLASGSEGAPPALALADAGMVLLARRASGRAGQIEELTVRSAGTWQALWQRQRLRDPQLAAIDAPVLIDLTGAAAHDTALEVPAAGELAVPAALRLAWQGGGHCLALDPCTAAAPLSARRVAMLAGVMALAAAALVHALSSAETARKWQAAVEAVPQAAVITAPAPAWTSQELAQVKAVNQAVRALNLPLSAILLALQPPPDIRVAVLSVATAAGTADADGAHLKIVAEARTGAEMARYVAFLAERKPFTGAYLSEHEIDENSSERPYRFTVEAAWKD